MSLALTSLSTAYQAGTPTRALTATPSAHGSTVTVALSDGGAGGTFFPASLSLASGVTSRQFVYTAAPGHTGDITLTATASGGTSGSDSVTLGESASVTRLFTDTFVGSAGDLVSHTATPSGGTWTKIDPGSGGGSMRLTGGSGTVRADGGGMQYDTSASLGASSEFDVIGTAHIFGRTADGVIELACRGASDSVAFATYTFCFYTDAVGWLLIRYGSGAGTAILGAGVGAHLTPQPATNGELRLAVRFIDAAQWLFGLYDGVLVMPPINDDNLLTGNTGIVSEVQSGTAADSAGQHLTAFAVDDVNWAAAAPPPLTTTFPNAAFFLSPGGFRLDGSAVVAPSGGPYLRLAFSNSDFVSVGIDTTINGALSADQMPAFRVIVDSQPEVFAQAAVGATEVILASGLSLGAHQVLVDIIGGQGHIGNGFTGTAFHTRLLNVQLANAAVLGTPALRTYRGILFGDSYAQTSFGAALTGPIYTFINCTRSFGRHLGFAFDCELGQQGIGGSGYVNSGDGGFPALPDWWDQYDATHTRTLGGLDFAWLFHGVNDHSQTDGAVTAAVTATLAAMRADMTAAAIFVIVPPNGTKRAAITSGVAAAADSRVFLIDLGDELAAAIPFTATETWLCVDGIHMREIWHGYLSAGIAARSRAALAAPGNPLVPGFIPS